MVGKGDPEMQRALPRIVEVNLLARFPEALADPGKEAEDRDEDGVTLSPDTGDATSDEEEEDSRRSEIGMVVVPRLSSASFEGKTTGGEQQAQGGNKEEDSLSNVELNAAGRQKMKRTHTWRHRTRITRMELELLSPLGGPLDYQKPH
ncbi:hypothetical protein JVU11DRAFT_9121 [Chiua virens]|nr:hypothetical protein JVU11DRAFT_9121 [Chiua virens]